MPLILTIAAVLSTTPHPGFDHNHTQLSQVLSQTVDSGSVSYGEITAIRHKLDAYLAGLRTVSPQAVREFARSEAMAFWINAYNALTLQLILDEQPKDSIKDIWSPWGRERFIVAGAKISLNTIEHEILRKNFGDPRIHAALVCASKSCPILESRAFTSGDLNQRLDHAMLRFLQDPFRNRYDRTTNTLRVSQIFKWYGDDFIERFASGQNKSKAIRAVFKHYGVNVGDAEIEWLDYDWSLNGTWTQGTN